MSSRVFMPFLRFIPRNSRFLFSILKDTALQVLSQPWNRLCMLGLLIYVYWFCILLPCRTLLGAPCSASAYDQTKKKSMGPAILCLWLNSLTVFLFISASPPTTSGTLITAGISVCGNVAPQFLLLPSFHKSPDFALPLACLLLFPKISSSLLVLG